MIECPKCGSNNLRYSHLRSPSERLASLLGLRPIRCRQCRVRFTTRTWTLEELRFARCPKCLRFDLGIWSESHYRVSAARSLLLWLGANPYRCEYCRHNFISFRLRKHTFISRTRRGTAGAAQEEE